MNKKADLFSIRLCASGLLMLLALAWLTISLPFVYSAQQAHQNDALDEQYASHEERDLPFSGTAEEKAGSATTTLSEEYLHDHQFMEQGFVFITRLFKCYPHNLYYAFHPELITPPPDAASV